MRIYTIVNDEHETEYWGNVTDYIKEIFGSIVKSAKILLITDYSGSGVTKQDAEIIANKFEKHLNKSLNKNFGYDCTKLIITFTNGRSIEFNTSEWATIRKI